MGTVNNITWMRTDKRVRTVHPSSAGEAGKGRSGVELHYVSTPTLNPRPHRGPIDEYDMSTVST